MSAFKGQFVDGISGAPREVDVELDDRGLVITEPGQGIRETWAYPEIRLVEEVYPGQPVRLRSRRGGDARLTVADPGFMGALAPRSRRFRRFDMQSHNTLRRALVWGGATVAVIAGLYFGMPLAAEPVASVIPLSWEERIGRTAREQVLSLVSITGDTTYCDGQAGLKALYRLTEDLTGNIDTRYTFRISVVNHPLVNAFAAPGGYIVIFRGLLDEAESADELAGVLAHEIGHVIERHGTEGLVRSVGWSLVLAAVAGDTSGISGIARDFGEDLLHSAYSRDLEREADLVGIRLLNQADIRGTGFADFFGRIAEKYGESDDGLAGYLSSHPPSRERAEEARRLARGRNPAMTDAEWDAVRNMCGERSKRG